MAEVDARTRAEVDAGQGAQASDQWREIARRYAGMAGGFFVFALLVHVPGYFHQLYDPDEATIADQAITLQHGGRLYIDAIDRKPPLPTYLYHAAFAIFGNVDLRPVHLVAALLLAVAACAVAADVSLRTRAQRVWAGVLMITAAVAFLPDAGQAANYAHFALAPGAVAMVLARRRSKRAAALAGLALAVAVLCRQTWLIGLLPAGMAVARSRRWSHLGWMFGGFAVGIGIVVAWLPTADVWHWVFASNEGFLLTGPNWSMVAVSFFGGLALLVGLHLPLLIPVALRIRAAGSLRQAVQVDRDLWIWWATATVAWISGFRFFAHYWIQSLPPLVLLAAPTAARITGRLRTWILALLVVVTTAAVVAGFTPETFRTLPNTTPLAKYVAAHSRPDQPILVWGNLPQAQWESDRPLGGALVHSDFVTGVSGNRTADPSTVPATTPGAYKAVLRSVYTHPPQLVLDTSTADLRAYGGQYYDGKYPLSVFPQLKYFVDTYYTLAARVNGVTIYRLRQEYSGNSGAGS
ncbi:hypothetical protein [Allobranchiibius huperziae]|uniref:Glycosyltransferase RgtA/B/C/D-like domain-containing protein n=1 Tax=Allobranchiibius huperziae TaxID=1874116 RepID=A0A853D7J9_9MICO|nr:hypothetical protein [Allobranchiibius huperziae]NYJ73366.1 hypothetical protein [Allobranchiibius huperziae]